MSWVKELYSIKDKDPYSQYGEGTYLHHILKHIGGIQKTFCDIGAGDGEHLSNVRYLETLGWKGTRLDKITGQFLTVDNLINYLPISHYSLDVLSIDTDGNDYYLLDEALRWIFPSVIIAEFNAHFTDSRTIVYNEKHEWDGTNYYGFTFEAGRKLAEKWGYKVIFQNDNLNMYFVRKHLVEVEIPEVKYEKIDAFPHTDKKWVVI